MRPYTLTDLARLVEASRDPTLVDGAILANDRARELINIAHPDFRAELTAKAKTLGYL